MIHSFVSRTLGVAAALVLGLAASTGAAPQRAHSIQESLAALEREAGGRLGVAALSTGSGERVMHRENERFAFCSTFKVLLVGAILKRSAGEPGLLNHPVEVTKADLVTWSPITEKHVGKRMSVSQLCAAALQTSDNTAANLLIRLLGGPPVVTAYARSIGDDKFRLDRWETALNTAIPGDVRDTTTAAAMAQSLQRLALGDSLGEAGRQKLVDWMRGNTTGAARIQAGVPRDWRVGDKTGTGDYGTTNDLAVIWPPGKAPIVLAVYFTQREKGASARSDVVARAARLVAEAFGD